MKYFLGFLISFFVITTCIAQTNLAEDTNKVFTFVEQIPEFPGGNAGLIKFLSDNIVYPQAERLKEIQGRTILRFVVMEDGKVDEVTVIKSAGSLALDNEAVRVVKMLPNFTPGTQQGKKVRVYYNLPITFKLSGKTEEKIPKKRKKNKRNK